MTSRAMAAFNRLIERIRRLEQVVSRQQTRLNNVFREGSVVEVDHETGRAIVNAHGVLSPLVPSLQQAGEVNRWTPLSVGQRVVLCCPGGDISRSFIMPGGYTDDVKQPHDKGAEERTSIGEAVITHTGEGFFFSVGGATLKFTKEGLFVDVDGVSYKVTGNGVEQFGGVKEHDGLNVGSTHVHGGVVPGGADTVGPH
ncbi:putative GpV [Pseudorhizobium banfieldiae]|uniref:Putative GpV n=1 Tax=Pseudorhizobium banfieldiae TaxID=1125847 RepID=L0NEE5_9HYPH|nr:phage baseplate assembly protein V [Pseudorhizobium banfieldiae]CAD6606225.1 phage baseplate assembly protein V [arsenite-oxidising bacterium NT-25]CCF19161.1 putative GpV [Pseudorhizobium banfieldiae]